MQWVLAARKGSLVALSDLWLVLATPKERVTGFLGGPTGVNTTSGQPVRSLGHRDDRPSGTLR